MQGKYIVLYFGPYAAWEFTPEERDAIPEAVWEAIFDDSHEPQPLTWNIGLSGGLGVERDGRAVGRYCWVPREQRPGAPQRPMRFEWNLSPDYYTLPEDMATDWESVDRKGELAWFRAAFAPELGRAGAALGRAPQLCWGIVHWNGL
jgi:hypothetical protein